MQPEEMGIIKGVLETFGADWKDNPDALTNRIVRALDEAGYKITQKETNT